ncbi:hypothetical protein [Bradyrhizobium sp. HKCCYLS20291]|uniref:hypothetical protein n=1 Tax=Bradyrhizobium sp. HKCCYLS20291 TaxID=3420766 RepID=UPI003EBC814F
MDDDPFHRRPPLSPFLEEVRRPREPVSRMTTLRRVLTGIFALLPTAFVFAVFNWEMLHGGLFGPIWVVIATGAAPLLYIVWALYRGWR